MTRSLRALTLASASGLALAASSLAPPAALAACNTVGLVTTCTGTSGGGVNGFQPVASGSTVINLGSLTGTSAGLAIVTNTNVVQNAGTISGGNTGIDVSGDANAITNDANSVITGGSNGITMTNGDNHAVVNNGTIITTGGAGSTGVFMEGVSGTPSSGSTLINSGTISAGTAFFGNIVNSAVTNNGTFSAIGVGITITGDNNAVTNNGTLSAGTTGIDITGNGNTITNTGTIVAPDGILDTSNGVSAAIVNSGIITALGGRGISLTVTAGSGTVLNSGTITADRGITALGDNIAVTNTGSITASALGVFVNGTGTTITNSGTISVPRGIAVSAAGGSFTLVNNGLIRAVGGTGVTAESIGTIVNNGIITTVDAAAGNAGTVIQIGGAGSTVTNNGVLDGTLSVGGTLINNGLIMISLSGVGITPAASASASGFGITHTVGVFQQSATGVLQVRADMAGNHDSLQVAGTATLGGTLQLSLTPAYFASRVVFANVVTANAFNGTRFATVSVTMPPSPFIVQTTEYTTPTAGLAGGAGLLAGEVVNVILSRIPFAGPPGLTINQQAVGTALDGGCSGALSGAGAALCTNVLFSTSIAVLDSLSAEIVTGVQTPSFMIGDHFLDAMLGQVQRRRGQPCGGGQSAGGGSGRSGRFAAWVSGSGTLSGHRDGDGVQGSARLNAADGGIAAGADMCLGPNLRIGFALGGARSDFSLDGRAANGNTRAVLAGTYGSWAFGPFYVDIGLAYGHSDFSTTRNVAFGALNERATGDFSGNQIASRLEAGGHFRFRGFSLMPFFGLTGQALRQSGFSETAINTATGQPGVAGLNYQSQTTNAPLPFLGGEASKTFQLGETATITPRLRLSWGYETSTDRQATGSFQSLSGASFTVNGARPARSGANIRAGVDGDLFGLIEFYAQVDSALAAGGNGFSAAAGVRMAW